jgi:hypothetical protein
VVKLSRWLMKVSCDWVILLSLVVFVLFMIFVLPAQSRQADVDTGGAGSPDMSLFYAPETLFDFAEAYGPDGRQAYIQARLTFDVVWPLVYAFFLTTSLSWLLNKGLKAGSFWRCLNLFPVMGLILDYFENLAAVLVMVRYPTRAVLPAYLALVFTPLKWIFVGGSFMLVLIGGVIVLVKRVKKQ